MGQSGRRFTKTRISLPGESRRCRDRRERVLLVHYQHQSADTPFRASHAIYVRPEADEAKPGLNEVPELLRSRMLSLRGFDVTGMMVHADLAHGHDLEAAVEAVFAVRSVEYIHLHFATPGGYAARLDRRVSAPVRPGFS